MADVTAVFKIDVIHGDTDEAAHKEYHRVQHDMRGTPSDQREERKPNVFIIARGPGADDRIEMRMPERWEDVAGLAIGDEVEIIVRRASEPKVTTAPPTAPSPPTAPPAPLPGHPV